MVDELVTHYQDVADELFEGNVIPFLGAGANLCGRPADASWTVGQVEYLPNAHELALYLAERFRYPVADERDLDRVADDLARVTQYVAIQRGSATPLYRAAQDLQRGLPARVRCTCSSRRLPALLRDAWLGQPVPAHRHDELRRRARAAPSTRPERSSTSSAYLAEGEGRRGKFMHQAARRRAGRDRAVPTSCIDLAPDNRTVILKIHGDVDRTDVEEPGGTASSSPRTTTSSSSRHGTDPANLVPVDLLDQDCRRAHFLFLGYSLRDWNLRVILYRLWREQTLGSQSWAVQRDPMSFERKFWSLRRVELLDIDLDEYVQRLAHAVGDDGHAG